VNIPGLLAQGRIENGSGATAAILPARTVDEVTDVLGREHSLDLIQASPARLQQFASPRAAIRPDR
jgi:hypothetical protein